MVPEDCFEDIFFFLSRYLSQPTSFITNFPEILAESTFYTPQGDARCFYTVLLTAILPADTDFPPKMIIYQYFKILYIVISNKISKKLNHFDPLTYPCGILLFYIFQIRKKLSAGVLSKFRNKHLFSKNK